MSDKQQTTAKRPQRLLALDILRGITIAGMILVNNPGSWGHIYAPLAHAQWHGLTPTDLVFPFFMYIMGISTYFSLRKYDFKFSGATLWKICRRTVVIFAIGLAIAWFGMFLRGITSGKALAEAVFTFDHIRILGVMPRLAICYGFGSMIALALSKKALPWFIAAMLVVYAVILFVGNGFEFASNNVIAIVDNAVLGPDHMYTDHVGDYVKKPMKDCNGEELLYELVHQFHWEEHWEELKDTVINVIPCYMPFIDAQFQPRAMADRPQVVPEGSTNFAMISQFVEIPEDMVFTEE